MQIQLSYLHSDHFDPAAQELLPKNITILQVVAGILSTTIL